MIKTVSFASPRAVSGTASKSSPNAGRTRAKALPSPAAPPATLSSLFPKPSAPTPIAASQAREQLQRSAPTSRSSASPAPEIVTAPASPAKRAPRRAAAPAQDSLDLFDESNAPEEKAVAPVPIETKAQGKPKAAPVAAPAPVQTPEATLAKPAAPAKKRRVKIPVNLAEQYGQSLSKRVETGAVVSAPEEETPRKRLNRAERQARRELMNPDDDLRARLERAHNAVPSAPKEKRPRGWRFDCGRCGQTSFFQTTGAICSCGALAIKD